MANRMQAAFATNVAPMPGETPWMAYAETVRIAAVLSVVVGVLGTIGTALFGLLATGVFALATSEWAVFVMSSASMLIAVSTAGYVYWTLVRARKQPGRLTAVEAAAQDIELHHNRG